MTLVVSEASRFGIVMVGDSALTVRAPGKPTAIIPGMAKVQFADKAVVGFALWGDACVGDTLMDTWLAEFIAAEDSSTATIDSIGSHLEAELRSALKPSSRTWQQMRRGIHIAGFVDGIPHIYHLHTGHDPNAQHEPTLFKDYPYGINMTPAQFAAAIATKPEHLRNGYYQHFAALYQAFEGYASVLPGLGINWPGAGLEDRCSYLSLQTQVVALTLHWSQARPAVNSDISSIAFTAAGLHVDHRKTPSVIGVCGGADELTL